MLWPTEGEGREGIPERRKGKEKRNREGGGGRREQKLMADIGILFLYTSLVSGYIFANHIPVAMTTISTINRYNFKQIKNCLMP